MKNIAELSQIKREKLVSTIKMLTGLEAEIVGDELQIKAGQLTCSQLYTLESFCKRRGLGYSLESKQLTFKIY